MLGCVRAETRSWEGGEETVRSSGDGLRTVELGNLETKSYLKISYKLNGKEKFTEIECAFGLTFDGHLCWVFRLDNRDLME